MAKRGRKRKSNFSKWFDRMTARIGRAVRKTLITIFVGLIITVVTTSVLLGTTVSATYNPERVKKPVVTGIARIKPIVKIWSTIRDVFPI